MQTFPGSQINWLLQHHPSSPGGEQAAAQPLPAPGSACLQPGARVLGAKPKDQTLAPRGTPGRQLAFPLCVHLYSRLSRFSFSFFYFASHSDPYLFLQVFALCFSPQQPWAGVGASGSARGWRGKPGATYTSLAGSGR